MKTVTLPRRKTSAAAAVCLILLLVPAAAVAGDVTLQWDANSETDLAGYRVYYGTASGVYGTPVVIGLTTTYTVANLPAGTYYFAVTAFNSAGLESGFSNEVTATVSGSGSSGCDINGDTRSDVLDLQVLSNVILGLRACPGSCDVNGDGRVDVLDLQVLANVILGLRSCP
jgi:hypothetical protein